jgi:UDP-N-acetylglucosamine--N-acetylmuramyl-(pentapeptide) pyrophosphoryl-undecaprenol N-acetylglucosamine transferase
VLHATSLAICRAGGTTLAELAAAGVPALLAPYPYASDDHQRLNAQAFVTAGAARCIDQPPAPANIVASLAVELGTLLANPDRLTAMSSSMHRLARPDAAWHIAMLVRDFTLRRRAAA